MAWLATICLRTVGWLVKALQLTSMAAVTRVSWPRSTNQTRRLNYKGAVILPAYKPGCT